MHRLAQVAVFAQELRIAASPGLAALYRAKAKLHPDLLWRLCDIQSYNPVLVELEAGCSWLPEESGWEGSNSWDLEEVEDMAPELQRAVAHPAHAPRRGAFVEGAFVHVAFDGGSSRDGTATAGYVIVDSRGEEVVRRGEVLDKGLTNNEAESSACLLALRELARLQDAGVRHLEAPIRVLGDS